MQLGAAQLIQLPLQQLNRTSDASCAFAVQYQPTSAAD
jgi:hypothetical protein